MHSIPVSNNPGPKTPEPGDDASLTVRRITPSDWRDYRDYYKGLKNPSHFRGMLAGKDMDAQETYTQFFDQTIVKDTTVMFGLWDGKKMIGQSGLYFIETDVGRVAFLAGSEIADGRRGERLVDRFYDARMQHLKDIGFEGDVFTTISPDNTSSQKAAQRNGFADTGQTDSHGYKIFRPGMYA